MATIVWNGQKTRDSETFAHVHQAVVDGKHKVSDYFSEEAMQDRGEAACKSVAEDKIEAGMTNGEPPKRVDVTTADFS